jgi:hypothetical protein
MNGNELNLPLQSPILTCQPKNAAGIREGNSQFVFCLPFVRHRLVTSFFLEGTIAFITSNFQ